MPGRLKIVIGTVGLVLAMAVHASPAFANVTLNGLFTDGAVLQRDQPIPVWGSASEGEQVTVSLRDRRATSVARGGKWIVRLPPMPAGGPYVLTISGRNRITLSNISVG